MVSSLYILIWNISDLRQKILVIQECQQAQTKKKAQWKPAFPRQRIRKGTAEKDRTSLYKKHSTPAIHHRKNCSLTLTTWAKTMWGAQLPPSQGCNEVPNGLPGWSQRRPKREWGLSSLTAVTRALLSCVVSGATRTPTPTQQWKAVPHPQASIEGKWGPCTCTHLAVTRQQPSLPTGVVSENANRNRKFT